MNIIKTTIEIDDDKLVRLMKLTGLKTRKEAIDFALTEAERIANLNHIAETPWSAEMMKDAVEPGYDVLAIRRQPVTYRTKSKR